MNSYDKPLDYGKELARAKSLAQVIEDYAQKGTRYLVPARYDKVYSEYLRVNGIESKYMYSFDDPFNTDNNEKGYEFVVIASNAEVCPYINKSVIMNYSSAKITFYIVSEEDMKSEDKAYAAIYNILFPYASNNGAFITKLYDFGVICAVDTIVAAILAAIPASYLGGDGQIEKGLAQRFGENSTTYRSILRNYDDIYSHIINYELSDTVELMNIIGADALAETIGRYKFASYVQDYLFGQK